MRLFYLCFILLLTGCGFSPLYYNDTESTHSVIAQTQTIAIEPIAQYDGYLLHNELERALNPQQNHQSKKYILTVKLSAPSFTDQSIQGNNFSSRKKMSLTAKYQLKDMQTKKILLSDSTRAIGAYNIFKEPYTTQMTQSKQKEDLIKILSQNISLRIIAYFNNIGE